MYCPVVRRTHNILLMKSNIAHGDTLPVAVSDDLQRLGAAIRAGRARRGETQETLAARLKISRRTLGAAERGDPGVSGGIYASLAWVVGLPGLSAGMPDAHQVPQRVRPSVKPVDDF